MAQIRDYTENAHTSNYNLSEGESGTLHSNRGAGSAVTIFLPENASMGVYYTFSVVVAQELRVDPGDSANLLMRKNGQDNYPGEYWYADAIGESILFVSNGFNEWYPIQRYGVWSHEP